MKIMSCCDNAYVSTGYGTAWTNILKRLPKLCPDDEFFHLGWQERGRERMTIDGFTHLPAGKLDKGYDQVFPYLMKIQPDYLITMADVGIQAGYIEQVFKAKQMGWKGKWIAWTPLDSYSWALGWDEIFDAPDINLAMAKFGEDQMNDNKVHDVKMIPLGVDTKVYKPLETRYEDRKKANLDNKFVVGFVGRNQKRKMIDRLVAGFANFSKDKDDVKLLLHTDMVPPDCPGWDIRTLLARFQKLDPKLLTEDKVNFTKTSLDIVTRQRIDANRMVQMYNMFDLFCYSTGGEGFGMPGIESQSCGVPIIMTDCTTGPELCGDHAKLIPVLKDSYGRDVIEIGQNAVENKYPDDIEMAKLLEEKYNLWKKGELKKEGEACRNHALKYDWDNISLQLVQLFENEI